ncbi:MAG: class I SAM-dependent methyltransferase [Luteibaculaceae bacterium]
MQGLISLATRYIPRHHLQKFSHAVLQLLAPFYAGDKFVDPITGKRYRKLLPYGRGIHKRENALAPHSLSLERHRLMWFYLKNETNFFDTTPKKILHIAPEYCFLKRFKKQFGENYITADLNSPWADMHFDVHEIPFEDNSFDVIFCNHVLEHVEDHQQVLREFYRVMKPGGFGIFQVPIDATKSETFQDNKITSAADRERYYWQADHVRLFGSNYNEELSACGFKVTVWDYSNHMQREEANQFAFMEGELLYCCTK